MKKIRMLINNRGNCSYLFSENSEKGMLIFGRKGCF